MTEKNGIVTFECDKDKNGNEILNSTQRNNEIVWPPKDKFPKAQYTTTWKKPFFLTKTFHAQRFPQNLSL